MEGRLQRLSSYRPRPHEGEEIPISFIDLERKIAAWSPELKHTVYLDSFENTDNFKRVREVFLLKVFNWYRNGESIVELTNSERMHFEDTLNEFLLYGGEIHYSRKKEGRKHVNFFRVEYSDCTDGNIRGWMLAEKL
ncbi:hypothetical protein J2755_000728 [Methanohalophilus levihalophilus]|uniref:hypothetical protein n=1 Tax=Methanohalophilus levihalophilus TaxID=1431282 RepID=UPI001AE7CC4D|nr:hypothetical protein [Methanohalophilus levihalophilus]MBP2029808.1 hypothetical protein [Methanohalophilus levihalophilus]